ncbi:myosin-11-like [Haliotis asinina]|uniref:myosin-11-like n=1 Tax=Haliotis asinina TaxID=109174 RepID=UPI0035319D6F
MAVVFLCIFLTGSLSGLVLTITKPDGAADISSIINHVALLEQTVTGLQKTTGQLESELQTSRSLQQLASKEIASLKDEVASLKADLRLSTDELNLVKAKLMKQGKGTLNQRNLNPTSLDVASDSAQVNSVQADVKMLRDQLDLMNFTLYDVKREADGFIQRASPIFQLIAQSQLIENMKSANLLAQNTSRQLEQFGNSIKVTAGDVLNVTHDLQLVSADLKRTEHDLSLTRSDVLALKTDMKKEKNQSLNCLQSLTQISQTMQSLNVTQDLQSVSVDLQTMKSILHLTRTDVTALTTDMAVEKNQSVDNKNTLAQVSQTMVSLTGDLLTTQRNLSSINSEVRNLERNISAFEGQTSSTRPPTIAFNVHSPSSRMPGGDLIFGHSLYNAGSFYDTSTGRFTAPVSGTYMFWTEIVLTESNSQTYIYIMRSDGWMAMDADVQDNHASMVVVDHVSKGSEVWVKTSSSHSITKAFPSSRFGGVLLSVD